MTMTNALEQFTHGSWQVRVVEIDGEPWFVAKDVCDVLGHTNSRKALSRLDDDEKSIVHASNVTSSDVKIPNRGMQVVNESGLYSLIMSSRKPEAKAFKRWITHEVIPSIRKHGAYMTAPTLEQAINNPDFMIGLLTNLKQEQQARLEAERKNEVLQPKADFYDAYMDSDGLTTLSTIGREFIGGVHPSTLRKFLQDCGVLYHRKVDGHWQSRHKYDEYFGLSTFVPENGTIVSYTLKATTKGVEFIINLWNDKMGETA